MKDRLDYHGKEEGPYSRAMKRSVRFQVVKEKSAIGMSGARGLKYGTRWNGGTVIGTFSTDRN